MEHASRVRALLSQVLANARDMKRMRITSVVDIEILTCLVEGRRTVGELAEQIYGARRTDPGYHTYYMKVRRAVKDLQRRGYVATRLFGKEKPYKLTPFVVARMMGADGRSVGVVPLLDGLIYVLTICLGLANVAFAGFSPFLSRPYMIMVYTVFVFLTGYSLSRLTIAFRKVK